MATKDIPNRDRDDEPKHGKDRHGKDLPEPTPLPSVPSPGLPPYWAEAVREADPAKPATKDAPKNPDGNQPAPPVAVYLADDVHARLRFPDRWKQTVIQNLVSAGIYRPVHDDDPACAINDLMAWSAVPLPHEIPEPEPEHKRR